MKELKPLIQGGAIKELAEELELSANLIYDLIGRRGRETRDDRRIDKNLTFVKATSKK